MLFVTNDYGGVSYVTLLNALSRGVDIVVLGKANRMLFVVFEEDLGSYFGKSPFERQIMLFSATNAYLDTLVGDEEEKLQKESNVM
ncbi:hypothetical protein DKX38_021171 [Salix brachista]|uniref:Uncharacterized protein n=1 Tax=Salix brachista TaxID=2182728 RepID=A0A5N5K9Q2_9ROSI|nr:hypothetical protein DKX38_021171 [Salix brachista]